MLWSPAPAQGADEAYSGDEFLAFELGHGSLDAERGVLGDCDFELGNPDGPVTVVGDFHGALGGGEGARLGL